MKRFWIGGLISIAVLILVASRLRPNTEPTPTETSPVQIQIQSGSQSTRQERLSNRKNKVGLDETSKTLISECLQTSPTFGGQSAPSDYQTFDQLLNRARGGEKPEISLQYLNLHGETAAGEKVRLHISRLSQDEPGRSMQIQIFDVAPDGFPALSKAQTRTYESLSTSGAIEKFRRSMNQITLDQRSEAYRWPSGESAEIRRENGEVTQIQIFLEAGKSLGCTQTTQAMNCRCLDSTAR